MEWKVLCEVVALRRDATVLHKLIVSVPVLSHMCLSIWTSYERKEYEYWTRFFDHVKYDYSTVSVRYYRNHNVHRTDGPAVMNRCTGDCFWYTNDMIHRDGDLPAVVRGNGDREWYERGERHRIGQPAVVRRSERIWYVRNQYHRTDGPAHETDSGNEWWYFEGKRHRDGGPACIHRDGTRLWFCHGKQLHRVDEDTGADSRHGRDDCENETQL